jgi:hypothetical protein
MLHLTVVSPPIQGALAAKAVRRTVVSPLNQGALAARAVRHINSILRNPRGLPAGKNKRKRLSQRAADDFRSALIDAIGYAAAWAANGPLPNRVQGRGRPPDNAIFIFIDDIVRACEKAGLQPGLRYVSGTESLPVLIYKELAPLLWPGSATAPRRVFERWQRFRATLHRR